MNSHDLDSLNDSRFFDLVRSEEDAAEFCQGIGLLLSHKVCCCKQMILRKRSTGRNKGFYFRCGVKSCRREVSLKKGTFFEGSNLSIRQIICLIYYFARDDQLQEELKFNLDVVSENTIVDWKNFCRDVCTSYFVRHPVLLGGIGEIVEVDESSLIKRKYNRGRLLPTQWVFGGYQPSIKEGFLVAVPNTKRETILPLIHRYIGPASLIISDCAKIYDTLSEEGYFHLTVNHSTNFVDPLTGATTNRVESQWQKVKQKNKERYGTGRGTLVSHLGEYMWRQRFGKSLYYFIEHIKEEYPLE